MKFTHDRIPGKPLELPHRFLYSPSCCSQDVSKWDDWHDKWKTQRISDLSFIFYWAAGYGGNCVYVWFAWGEPCCHVTSVLVVKEGSWLVLCTVMAFLVYSGFQNANWKSISSLVIPWSYKPREKKAHRSDWPSRDEQAMSNPNCRLKTPKWRISVSAGDLSSLIGSKALSNCSGCLLFSIQDRDIRLTSCSEKYAYCKPLLLNLHAIFSLNS